jgi:membrane protein DedA with SNARE-associated domain
MRKSGVVKMLIRNNFESFLFFMAIALFASAFWAGVAKIVGLIFGRNWSFTAIGLWSFGVLSLIIVTFTIVGLVQQIRHYMRKQSRMLMIVILK